jgi:fructose-1,6-bisphosphatase/inositol monophosphatase family enzyme
MAKQQNEPNGRLIQLSGKGRIIGYLENELSLIDRLDGMMHRAAVAAGDGTWARASAAYMSPWDTLAGTLLVEEAGGLVTTFGGAARPTNDKADILATNGHLHDDMLARFDENQSAYHNGV